ncbi:3-oxoacid CoA-transferase, A subunit [Thermosinus carboxydivorans Nor1]|uniref:3-oxoacid CoA-transferase, A subunit n=1 Tax=Thermosinus carboxydivorans Nor1 TaxID=401526 RepID=A1HND1_9FIRM|nr:CoA transferase subunit A [Thermosinus carboxydivorans]EAX48294.1 3-oxoacid CoA-transferase, A subunit [Thermosinus carboxydivorans Nor1]
MNKVMDLDKVMEKVHDGATIMIGGFLGVGAPLKCIEKLVERQVKDLTLIAVVNSYPGGGFDLAPLFKNKQVKKFITAHTGTCPEALEIYKSGELEVEFYPMGTWIEKIRAGGAGLGGVLTPIGVGTLVEEGKQKLTINGKEYLLELPLRADFAFIKGYRADRLGNVQYRGVSINSNPILAMAADYTVAEVNEIVEVGDIEPERVGTPGIFVKAVVQGYTFAEHQEIFKDLWVRTGRLS